MTDPQRPTLDYDAGRAAEPRATTAPLGVAGLCVALVSVAFYAIVFLLLAGGGLSTGRAVFRVPRLAVAGFSAVDLGLSVWGGVIAVQLLGRSPGVVARLRRWSVASLTGTLAFTLSAAAMLVLPRWVLFSAAVDWADLVPPAVVAALGSAYPLFALARTGRRAGRGP